MHTREHCKLCTAIFEMVLPDQEFLIKLHNQIIEFQGYNFNQLQVPVYSKLNISFWKEQLIDFDDKEICSFLEFGWPLGFNRNSAVWHSKRVKNHTGARNFAKDIDKYIKKEIGYGAILGPFRVNPFKDELVISPLNYVPKANTEERRVILDLSFPAGSSVNDGIDKNMYLDKHVELHYPNVDNFIELIKQKVDFVRYLKEICDVRIDKYLLTQKITI